jgi:hypothetical protein
MRTHFLPTAVAVASLVPLTGCAVDGTSPTRMGSVAGDPSNGRAFAGYVPLDPLPVLMRDEKEPAPATADERNRRRLNMLPDETVRIAISDAQGNFGVTYGVASAKAKGASYLVVLDYMKFTTTILSGNTEKGFENAANQAANAPRAATDIVVPVYTGIGLRITAEVTVLDADVNLGSLFAIGAAAEAKKLRGTLIVQSIGIGGPEISAAIPMPSEINQTTIANAITALATIKSKIHATGTSIEPRVLGIYDMTGEGQITKNKVITRLLKEPPTLPRIVKVETPNETFWDFIARSTHPSTPAESGGVPTSVPQ